METITWDSGGIPSQPTSTERREEKDTKKRHSLVFVRMEDDDFGNIPQHDV
jgi:hypothetical protein